MIEVQSLTRLYGKLAAVDEVSFNISDHEIVGLLGHNGAGKTTIMQMLSGYLEPSAGSIIIDGVELCSHAPLVQRHLGYLPENLPVYPEMMVADYLDYVATLKRIPSKERLTAVKGALLATDLTDRALDRIQVLSRGFRQRVGVAQAILGQPQLLILDEPTNGLDPNQAAHMRQLIKRLARQSTVILSTHIMQEVEAVCDRVLMLRHGKLVLDQGLSELHESRTLLLRTDAAAQPLASYLDRLPQIASLDSSLSADGLMVFDIHLHPEADPDTAANNVAQCVVTSGAKLYQLRSSVRDLDSVFREAYTNGD
jgi:ABC-2 type transport system ATP-binding protein